MAGRAWVATEIGVRLATPLADAEMSAADTTGNLKEPIDDALRLIGFAEADIPIAEAPDVEDSHGFLIAVRYTALRAIRDRIADRFDIGTARGGNFRLNQVIANIDALLATARSEFIEYWGDLGGDVVAYDLGYLGGRTEREYIG